MNILKQGQRAGINYSGGSFEDFLALFGNGSEAGIEVTPTQARQMTAVSACIKVISETLGQISADVYKNSTNGKELAPTHSLFKIIHTSPNKIMTSTVFHQTMAATALEMGNSYARIWRDKYMNVTELQIIPFADVKVKLSEDKRSVYYEVEGIDKIFQSWEILHIKGPGYNGIVGYSPLRIHANALGLGLAEQQFASKYFANGAVLSGLITVPGKATPDILERIRNTFQQTFGSSKNANKTMVLDNGMTYQANSANAEQSQLLESRKFSVTEIARIFRVPPHMIGDLTQSTNNNIEHQGLEFSKYTMIPWVRRFEQEYNSKLFKENEKEIYFVRFNVESLQRGDTITRTKMYVQAIQNGWLSPNEARQMEGFNKREGGDIYLTPLNMTTNPEENGQTK